MPKIPRKRKTKNEGEQKCRTDRMHTQCLYKKGMSVKICFLFRSFLKNISIHVWNGNIAIVCHDVYGIKLKVKKPPVTQKKLAIYTTKLIWTRIVHMQQIDIDIPVVCSEFIGRWYYIVSK